MKRGIRPKEAKLEIPRKKFRSYKITDKVASPILVSYIQSAQSQLAIIGLWDTLLPICFCQYSLEDKLYFSVSMGWN